MVAQQGERWRGEGREGRGGEGAGGAAQVDAGAGAGLLRLGSTHCLRAFRALAAAGQQARLPNSHEQRVSKMPIMQRPLRCNPTLALYKPLSRSNEEQELSRTPPLPITPHPHCFKPTYIRRHPPKP